MQEDEYVNNREGVLNVHVSDDTNDLVLGNISLYMAVQCFFLFLVCHMVEATMFLECIVENWQCSKKH